MFVRESIALSKFFMTNLVQVYGISVDMCTPGLLLAETWPVFTILFLKVSSIFGHTCDPLLFWGAEWPL